MGQDSLRRVIVAAVAAAVVLLNKKLGFALGTEDVAAIAVIATGYILGSNYKAAAELQAKVAAEKIQTLAAADKVMKR
jgi:hypothetical protein